MNLSVNGSPAPVPSPATVAGLVAAFAGVGPPGGTGGVPPTGGAGAAIKGIAVAVNGEVVPRSAWETTGLHPGDRVEVLTAAQGG